jgi:hypothetical protein
LHIVSLWEFVLELEAFKNIESQRIRNADWGSEFTVSEFKFEGSPFKKEPRDDSSTSRSKFWWSASTFNNFSRIKAGKPLAQCGFRCIRPWPLGDQFLRNE